MIYISMPLTAVLQRRDHVTLSAALNSEDHVSHSEVMHDRDNLVGRNIQPVAALAHCDASVPTMPFSIHTQA